MASFIDDYLTMVKGTKPPYEYQVWSMLATLSAFAGRKVWFPLGPLRFYPNLYVTLVGDPAIAKSTAMGRSMDIVRSAKCIPMSGTRTTKEALMKRMAAEKFPGQKFYEYEGRKIEYNQFALYATELVDFLGADAQGFLDFLTAAWDQPMLDNDTKNKGQDIIVGPYITFLACMTPEKLKGFMKLSILTGGFARRCAFVFSNVDNFVPHPSYTDEQKACEQRCIQRGIEMQKLAGPFSVTKECDELYMQWGQENHNELRQRHPSTRGWYSSKAEMLWKLSMLIAMSDGNELLIDVPHYRIAMKFCELVEKNLERVFEGTGINPNANASAQIVRMVEALTEPIKRKKLEVLFMDQVTDLNALRDTVSFHIQVGRLGERVVNANGTLVSFIGTPAVLGQYTDVELVGLASSPPPESSSDQSSKVGPS